MKKGKEMKTSDVENLLYENDVLFDKISKRHDVFTVKRSFFYTHGFSSEKLANKIQNLGFRIVDHFDDWNSWPKTSYFVVKFQSKV